MSRYCDHCTLIQPSARTDLAQSVEQVCAPLEFPTPGDVLIVRFRSDLVYILTAKDSVVLPTRR